MPKSAIAARPKRPPTPAERLRKVDPELAAQMDAWEQQLNRDYQDAFEQDPAPPILDQEVALATEGWRLLDTAAVLYATVDDLQVTADAARAALARLALEAFTPPGYTTYQSVLPPEEFQRPQLPPPDSFDGGDDTEDFHGLRGEPYDPTMPNMDALIREAEETPDDADRPGWWPKPMMAVRRLWAPIAAGLLAAATTATLLLRGVG